eukprot:jgi/Undpi1/13177/HiC_scaffold_8.g02839.m1
MFSGSGSSPTIPGKVDPLTSSRKSGSPAFWVTQALECGMAVPGGTAIPHFNVWVTREAGLPLLPELVRRLPGSVGDDPESKNMLKNQADAQVEMTMEEVIAVIVAEDAREQRTPTKDFTGVLAFVANARAEKTVKGPAVLKWMSAALGLHLQQWPP